MSSRDRPVGVGGLVLVLGLAALIWMGGRLPAACAQGEIFVTNPAREAVTVYVRTASGDIAPLRTLTGGLTGLKGPMGVAVDAVNNELVITSSTSDAVMVYARTASGDTAPLRTLTGGLTGLKGPMGVAVDAMNNEFFVTSPTTDTVVVHARTASGNVAPLRTLSGGKTLLKSPMGVAVDPVNNELVVTSSTNDTVTVYARTASGDAAPLRTLTGLKGAMGVAVDAVNNEFFVTSPTTDAVVVHARTATGSISPLRTLAGGKTGLAGPVGVAVDAVNGELLVTNPTNDSVTVYTRTASGDTGPLRTMTGALTGLKGPQFLAVSPASTSSLVAAVLPASRSVQVGTTATAFATVINTGSSLATGCALSLLTSLPATFSFQTTDPATNQVTGTLNTPVDIPGGGLQTFVFALTPTAPVAPIEVQISFDCTNTDPAPIVLGLTTLLFSSSATPVPDIVALAATLNNDGIVNIPGATGTGAFSLATVNVGASGTVTVFADTGGASLPVIASLCQTNPATGQCISPIGATVTTLINANATPTFAVFVTGSDPVPFNPATNRVFVRFKDSAGVIRGATSVAVRTL